MVAQMIASGMQESTSSTVPETETEKGVDFLSPIVAMAAEIKREMAETPVGLDQVSQAAVDDKLREKVTALGHLIGTEAERLINFSHEANMANISALEAIHLDIEQLRDDQATSWLSVKWVPVSQKTQALLSAVKETAQAEKKITELRLEKLKLRNHWLAQSEEIAGAYRAVMEKVRPMGGELKTHAKSSRMAKKILRETVEKTYPQDWIETSNNATHPLALKVTRDSGFYEPKPEESLTNEKGQLAYIDVWEAPQEDAEEIVQLLSENDNKAWITDCPPWKQDDKHLVEINYYGRFPLNHKVKVDGERVKSMGQKFFGYAPGEDEDFPEEKSWYQHAYIKGSEKDGLSPVLNISIINFALGKKQTAYHEFMHHMQNLRPQTVRRLEKAFFVHRTTKNGERNALHEVTDEVDSKNNSEVFYRDGEFVDPYMGREYPFSHDLEVITTGMESLFSKAYGSLLGFHGWQADIEHRNFTLGLLAVA